MMEALVMKLLPDTRRRRWRYRNEAEARVYSDN